MNLYWVIIYVIIWVSSSIASLSLKEPAIFLAPVFGTIIVTVGLCVWEAIRDEKKK